LGKADSVERWKALLFFSVNCAERYKRKKLVIKKEKEIEIL